MRFRPVLSVILLFCLLTLEAARYGDYPAAQMPHFGISYENKESPSVEYPDRSPDAAPPFDYKYEEEPKNKLEIPEQYEEETWQRNSKKRIKAVEREEVYPDEQDSELDPRFKSRRSFQKHRTRIKENKRKHVDYDASRNEDVDDLENSGYINNQRQRDENGLDSDDFDFKYPKRKIIRRKPRDRTISGERTYTLNTNDDEIDVLGKNFDRELAELENRREPHRELSLERTRMPYLDIDKIKEKNYPEYEDTLRFNTIKDKLPGLFRQTKASSLEMTPSTRPLQDISFRRANFVEKSEATFATEASSIVPSINAVTDLSRPTIDQNKSTPSNSTELSLAEKSKLSILKKVQKKEGSNMTRTTKPPVLMHVTKQMQTVVMIESPNLLRAREVFNESPDRVKRAKKLMRRKLVAGARSINDLIDNWDEMVCDYIDTSLLDSGGYKTKINNKIVLLSTINYLISNTCLNIMR